MATIISVWSTLAVCVALLMFGISKWEKRGRK